MKSKRYVPPGVTLRNRIIIIAILMIIIISIRFLYSYGKDKALIAIPKDGNMKFMVEFCNANLIQNSSVGNNWSFEARINGEKIKEGRKRNITVILSDKISLGASVKEHDFIADIGTGSTSVNIKDLKLAQKNTYPIDITVVENKGIYSGNIAVWQFNFSVTRKVSFLDILNNIF